MIAILNAAGVAMIASLIGTRVLITIFKRIGKGQPILGAEDRGPVQHMKKQGTPTMGGIAILFSAALGWFVAFSCVAPGHDLRRQVLADLYRFV